MSADLESKILALAREVVATTPYSFYDAEYNKRSKVLSVFIFDKQTNTALIEDCVFVDRAFTEFVENASWIPDDFTLEVSSPGVFRKLKTAEHFEKALNERITIDFLQSLKHENKKLNNKKSFKDVYVVSIKDGKVELDILDEIIIVSLDEIKKAKLDPEF
jgi:ribosome maturation factor RimP